MSWFEDWFDSPLYEKLYANRDEEEAARLGVFLKNVIPKDSYPEVLDLGCGRGRHSIWLAREGYRVTGIDLSSEAILKARDKAAAEGLDNAEFKVRDKRNPLDKKFDAVVNLFTTFGYFKTDEENAKVFDAMAAMLRDEGKTVIDFMNAEKVEQTFVPFSEGEFQDLAYKIRRYKEGEFIKKEISFKNEETGKTYSYQERVKLYKPEWFQSEMSARGFRVDHIYGNYRGEAFEGPTSDRMLLVATYHDQP